MAGEGVEPAAAILAAGLRQPLCTRRHAVAEAAAHPPAAVTHPLRRFALAFVVAFLVAAAVLWPVTRDLGGTLLGGAERGGAGCPAGFCADGTGTVRDYWAAEAQGTNAFRLRRDELNGAPEGIPRAPAIAVANAFQPGIVLALRSVTDWVTAWNIFLLLGFAATAATMFIFLERVGANLPAAIFGAYAFAFSPFALEKALSGQIAFVHAWVFPLIALAFLRMRDRPMLAHAILAGLAVALAFYVQSYFGFIALLQLAILAAVYLSEAEDGPRQRVRRLKLIAVAFGTTVSALLPPLLFSLLDSENVDRLIVNTSEDFERLGASVPAYLLPWQRSPLFGDLTLSVWDPNTSGEPALFYGYVTLALAALAVIVAWRRPERRRFAARAAAALVVAGFLFSLPRTVELAGVSLPTPSFIFSTLFSFIRNYARFGVLVGFGLITLAALALTDLARFRWAKLATLAAMGLLLVEITPVRALDHFDATSPPAYASWLRGQPVGIVASYPTVTAEAPVIRLGEMEFYNQTFHGKPLYALWAGNVGRTREEAIRILSRDIEDPLTPAILSAEGVRYAVVHDGAYRELGRVPPRVALGLELAASFDDVRIFLVRAEPADLAAELERQRATIALVQGIHQPALRYESGFYDPELFNGTERRWLGDAGRLKVTTADAGNVYRLTGLAFSARRGRVLELLDRDGRVVAQQSIPTAEVELSLGPFRLGKGRTTLLLRTKPGPERLAPGDTRIASVFFSPISVQPLADYSNSLRR